MKTTIITGLYRLDERVKNPKPDKRKTRDWTAAEYFEPGLFIISFPYPENTKAAKIKRMYGGGYSEISNIFDLEKFDAIQSALVLTEPKTPEQVLRLAGLNNLDSDVLNELYKAGKITLDDVRDALNSALDTINKDEF